MEGYLQTSVDIQGFSLLKPTNISNIFCLYAENVSIMKTISVQHKSVILA